MVLAAERRADEGFVGTGQGRDDVDLALDEAQAAFGKEANRLWIDAVFLTQDARRKALYRIVFQYRYGRLNNDWAGIDSGIDEVDGTAGNPSAVLQGLLLRIQTGKGGQQGRVDVHDAAGKSVEKLMGDQPHETGQHDQIHIGFGQAGNHGPVEIESVLIVPLIDAQRWNACLPPSLQGSGGRLIAENQGNFGVEGAVLNTIDDRLQIGSPAGGKNTEA